MLILWVLFAVANAYFTFESKNSLMKVAHLLVTILSVIQIGGGMIE